MKKYWEVAKSIVNAKIVTCYNKIIRVKWINKKNKVCRRLRAALFHNICYECHARFGKENEGRIFYLIRCPQAEMGLFAVINFVIFHIGKAVELGAEPVVDWQHYPNKYFSDDNQVGKENAWEYFFEQTTNITLEELYKSKHVIMSGGDSFIGDALEANRLQEAHKLIEKYIKLNKITENILKKECERIGIGKYKMLGVKCRGTDFVASKPTSHAIVPDVQMTIKVIEEKMDEWGGYDRIYLSTEDSSMKEDMKKYFGEKLYCMDAGDVGEIKKGKWLGDLYDIESGEKKKNDMQVYLVSTYILAACDALIAPDVGGTIGAMRIKGRYEHSYIFRMGSYE